MDSADSERRHVISEIRQSGDLIATKVFNLPDSASRLQIKHALTIAYNNPRDETIGVKHFDLAVKQSLARHSERMNKLVELDYPEYLLAESA